MYSPESIVRNIRAASTNLDENFLQEIIRQEKIDLNMIKAEDMTEEEKNMMA